MACYSIHIADELAMPDFECPELATLAEIEAAVRLGLTEMMAVAAGGRQTFSAKIEVRDETGRAVLGGKVEYVSMPSYET